MFITALCVVFLMKTSIAEEQESLWFKYEAATIGSLSSNYGNRNDNVTWK